MLDLVEVRRGLHRIPELAFDEHETSEMLHRIITGLVGGRGDVTVTRYRTGIIVHVPAPTGADSAGTGGRTIGWRADMDGLPVAEETGLPFASAHPGVMHACGHDVHMTVGLGVLEQVLNRVQRHSFVFLFQPAEENISGAQEIGDAGLLDEYRISEFYALHVSPEWDAGVIATRPGPLLAGSSGVTVEFTGVAGHAGMPHRAVDPIVSVASFVLQVQAMIARNFDPAHVGVVLTFGTISGGTVVNGIAGSAKVMGTLRFLDTPAHDLAFRRISEIAAGVALATGATAHVRLEDSAWVPVHNDPAITARFTGYVRSRAGAAFADAPVTMASEDYGYLLQRIPGMMFWLGTGRGHPLHSGKFAVDERAIEPAVRLIGDYLAGL